MRRTPKTRPAALTIDPTNGHPQVVTMMPATFGGGIMRNGQPGLGTARNGTPCLLWSGAIYTTGTHLEWSIGTTAEPGSSGAWTILANTPNQPATQLAAGGAPTPNHQTGTAQLPGTGMRRIDIGLWANGQPGVVAAPASTWQILTNPTSTQ